MAEDYTDEGIGDQRNIQTNKKGMIIISAKWGKRRQERSSDIRFVKASVNARPITLNRRVSEQGVTAKSPPRSPVLKILKGFRRSITEA